MSEDPDRGPSVMKVCFLFVLPQSPPPPAERPLGAFFTVLSTREIITGFFLCTGLFVFRLGLRSKKVRTQI